MNDQPQKSTHPGLYVREHVLPRGLTVTEAARRMGVGRPALSNFLNGKATLSPAMAIRLERTFGADRDALLDLQTRFDAREAPAGRRAITAATYAPSVLTIRAREIEDWAGRIESRQKLGALVRRLVNSTGRDLSKVYFPAYDHAERRGWDGVVVASTPTPWIPEGESGWELSCDARPKDKASNDDFARRTKAIPPRERKACTFVFVTPRDWPGKAAWASEKARLGVWKDVRAYDASDLEQWIEQSVPVQVWFAERLGRPAAGYRSLTGFWTEWTAAAKPALSPQLFATAVERHSERFQEWLGGPPTRPFTIAADSRDEAIAFLACLMGQEDGDNRIDDRGAVSGAADHRRERDRAGADADDRGIVFDTTDALHRLASAAPGAFVAVAGNREVEKAFSGLCRNIHCVAPRPRNAVVTADPPVDVMLDLPGYEDFRKALEAMDIRGGKAERLTQESARSPTILRRRLSVVPAVREPDWGSDLATAGKVIPAAMIGTWHASSRVDREIVSRLAGTDYEDVESSVAEMLRLDDPPVWSIGQYRGVVSRLDALFAIAPFVTDADLERVFRVAEDVLSESDPALELPESERWMAAVHGKVRDHSNALRHGIGETLILLAVYGRRLFDGRLGGNVESRISDLVRRLLSPLDAERLLAFQADLPALAEAAPRAFLEIFEEDLQGDESALLELMKPVDSGMFGTGRSRAGILSALECLAWSPTHFPRVIEILARLSYRKIDDNRSATPKNTLRSLFRYWMPDTDTAIDQRMRALDGLVARHPEIGWWLSLCMARRPREYGIISRCYRPRWRGDPSHSVRPITLNHDHRLVRKSRDICLNWPIQDEETLGDLVASVEALDEFGRSKVCELLERWADEPQSDQAKEYLRIWIRRCLLAHGLRASATVTRMRRVLDKLEPADIVVRHRSLFTSGLPLYEFGKENLTFEEKFDRVRIQQRDALREIRRERGFGGLNSLIAGGHVSHVIGSLIPEILNAEQETAAFVRWCLDKMSENGTQRYEPCLQSFLWTIDADSLPALVEDIGRSHGESGRLRLFLSMPYWMAWKLLQTELDMFREAYWEKVEFGLREYSAEEIHEMVDRLLEADRPLAALQTVLRNWDAVETSRLTKLLHALAGVKEQFDDSSLPEAFKSLDRRTDVTDEEKVNLEFMFFRVLERSEYELPNLAKQVMLSPALYAEAVIRAFKRGDQKEDPPEIDIDDMEKRKVLADLAYEFLQWVHRRIPDSVARGDIDVEKLSAWLAEVRALCAQYGRAEVGDLNIGELLSRVPPDDGGQRPCRAVCVVLEQISSADVDQGFIIGTYNARGVVIRPVGEGGDQERTLAAKYRDRAQQIAYEYPHVSSILERIASSHDCDARRRDTEATLRRRFPNRGPMAP